MKKITLDGREIIYKEFHRKVKSPRLEFENGMLSVILPSKFTEAKKLLKKHKKWITKQSERFEEIIETSRTLTLREDVNMAEFKAAVEKSILDFSEELNVNIEKTVFRKFKSRWGSCSTGGKITINTLLMFLPDRLIDYILLHEVAHRVEKKHNGRFYMLMEKKFGDRKSIEWELAAYWYLIRHSCALRKNGNEL